MEKISYAIFIDFDGTITKNDVCEALITNLAEDGWQEINKRWEAKDLSTIESAQETFKLFKTHEKEIFQKIVDKIELEDGLKDFLHFCHQKSYPVYILSDGYDYYIDYILKKSGIELPYYANKLVFNNGLQVEAPYQSINCKLCGVCKLELIHKLLKPNQVSVYIGDSYSDFCPAQKADIIFAKKRLYDFCRSIKKKATQFDNFYQVINGLMDYSDGTVQ